MDEASSFAFGGTRNAMVMKWPDRITEVNSLRNQFHHVIDIAPTILAAAGLNRPETVNGIKQMPVDGVSMEYSFNDADALSARKTQYFEIFGNRAIFHEGWIASCFHGRVPGSGLRAMSLAEIKRSGSFTTLTRTFRKVRI